MNYKQFEKYMMTIEDSLDLQMENTDVVNVDFLGKVAGNIIDQFIELISQQFDDPFDTVSWFVFDTKFGTQNSIVIDENGDEHDLNCIEALWNFLNK